MIATPSIPRLWTPPRVDVLTPAKWLRERFTRAMSFHRMGCKCCEEGCRSKVVVTFVGVDANICPDCFTPLTRSVRVDSLAVDGAYAVALDSDGFPTSCAWIETKAISITGKHYTGSGCVNNETAFSETSGSIQVNWDPSVGITTVWARWRIIGSGIVGLYAFHASNSAGLGGFGDPISNGACDNFLNDSARVSGGGTATVTLS